jgi:hypothetical protein
VRGFLRWMLVRRYMMYSESHPRGTLKEASRMIASDS